MHTSGVRAALVILLCLIGPTVARAKVVVMEPPVVYQCRQSPTWNAVLECMKKLGKITNTRAVAGGKLVQLEGDNPGVYLFTQHAANGPWTIGGIYQQGNAIVLDFAPVTLNKHAGFRIDLGARIEVGIQVDDVNGSVIGGESRQNIVMFCGGDNYYCEQAMVSCDARAHGRTYNLFRGTLRIDGNEVHVDGDRSRAGSACQGTDHFFLGWGPNK